MNGGGGSVGGGAMEKVAGRRYRLVVVGFVWQRGDLVVIRESRRCRYGTTAAQMGNGDSGCLKTRGQGSVGGGAPEKVAERRSGAGDCWVCMAERISGGCTGTSAVHVQDDDFGFYLRARVRSSSAAAQDSTYSLIRNAIVKKDSESKYRNCKKEKFKR
ncbi:hypothetical protein VNO78_25143 [Psophocarpus tetragonolobus]|uniref:Uncharacterized protein n=1 Tax=Psophocarpus tetragonolobus TaxID=3891 RepID=A0AAN9XES7_PSOTE